LDIIKQNARNITEDCTPEGYEERTIQAADIAVAENLPDYFNR